MQTEQKKAVIYCRVSTKEQVEEGNSLSTQEKLCRDYALKNGYDIAGVFIEQGESAKTALRTELQRLLSYCAVRGHGVSAVIAYKLDRISRNTDDYSYLRILLKRYGVEIKSSSEYFENTPAGRFMENIIANVAQFDNDVRTERSVGGMREAVREGRYVWMAPVGYANVKIAGRATIARNDKAPVILKSFEEVAKNVQAVEEIRRRMINEGLTNPKGKPVSRGYFYRMLRNELYAGWIIKFGERHKGLFEPIITDELFAQVQRALKCRTHRSIQYNRENPDFPLRRFISHPSGGKLTGCWCKGRSKKYAYYRFLKPRQDFKQEVLEIAFMQFLDRFELDENHFASLRTKAKEHLVNTCSKNVKLAKRAESEMLELKEKRRLVIDKNLQGFISNEVLQEQLAFIEESLIKAYPQLHPVSYSETNFEVLLQIIEDYLRHPSSAWKKASFNTRLKLQWFNFPKGILFDGQEFQTKEIRSLFNAKSKILGALSPVVNLQNDITNHNSNDPYAARNKAATYGNPREKKLYCDDPFWNEVGNEIVELSEILKAKDDVSNTSL